jgi:hypothetical protein
MQILLSAVFQNFLSRNFVLATLSPIEYLEHQADVGPDKQHDQNILATFC